MRSRITPAALSEVKAALKDYSKTVPDSDLTPRSQHSYVDMADNFVRWPEYNFEPGSRLAPYSIPKVKKAAS
jgi:hypothetical protein